MLATSIHYKVLYPPVTYRKSQPGRKLAGMRTFQVQRTRAKAQKSKKAQCVQRITGTVCGWSIRYERTVGEKLRLVRVARRQVKNGLEGFPGGAVVESLPANAGDMGSSPGLGRSHMPRSNWAREPQLLSLCVWSLCSTTREATIVRGPRTAMKSGPHLLQLEEALAQKRSPNTAQKINK